MGASELPATRHRSTSPASPTDGRDATAFPRVETPSSPRALPPAAWQAKVGRIRDACEKADVAALAALARTRGGLLTDALRRKAWPILLGVAAAAAVDTIEGTAAAPSELRPHPEEGQVQLDVDRAFVYYPPARSEAKLTAWRKDLFDVIVATLRQHPTLCYFQGFHDIAQVLLLVLGADAARPAVAALSLLRIRDFMLPSLEPSLVHLQLLPAILHAADPTLHRHLRGVRPFFALAATLTLYAHEVDDYSQIARLYDFLLAHEAAVSIYLFATIILSRKEELLALPDDDPDILTFSLSKLPTPLDLEQRIADTLDLFEHYPPRTLPGSLWRHISPLSVLKSTQTHPVPDPQGTVRVEGDLNAGAELFAKQLVHLRRTERRQLLLRWVWSYRRPIAGVAAAALVGALSFWVQRVGPEQAMAMLSVRSLLRYVRH